MLISHSLLPKVGYLKIHEGSSSDLNIKNYSLIWFEIYDTDLLSQLFSANTTANLWFESCTLKQSHIPNNGVLRNYKLLNEQSLFLVVDDH